MLERGRIAVVALAATTTLVLASQASPAAGGDVPTRGVALNDCWSTDNGLPVLTEVHLGAEAVDTTGGPVDIPVTARAVDTGGPGPSTGVRAVEVSVGVPAVPKIGGDGRRVQLTLAADGSWTGLLLVPRWGVRAPEWRVHEVVVTDGAGNRRVVALDQLQAAGQSPVLDITSSRDAETPGVADLTVSPRRLDVRRAPHWVRFGVRAVDASSGVQQVTVNGTVLHRTSGTTADGWWRAQVRVHRWAPRGRNRLVVRITDAAGNLRVAWWGPLREHGLPSYYVVRSVPDRSPPRVRNVHFDPPVVDVRVADAEVSVALRVTDPDSGVAGVQVALLGDPQTVPVQPLHLRKGGVHDGVWRGRMRFPRCLAVPGPFTLRANLVDRAGHATDFEPVGRVEVAAADHQGAGMEIVREYGPGSDLQVRFSEPVVGLTPETLLLHRLVTSPEVVAVPGTWLCRDRTAAVVDCVAGPVREATFLASEPAARGTGYEVVANPEHVLGLTDLAGNPSAPRGGGSWSTGP